MVCEGAEIRGLFILSKFKWHIFIVVLWTKKKIVSKPSPEKWNLWIKLWERNVVFTQDFKGFFCRISATSVMWRGTIFPCCEVAHGTWCHPHPWGSSPCAAPTAAAQLELGWKASRGGQVPCVWLGERMERKLLLPGSIFEGSLPYFVPSLWSFTALPVIMCWPGSTWHW